MKKVILLFSLFLVFSCTSSKDDVNPDTEKISLEKFLDDGGIYELVLPNGFIEEYKYPKSVLKLSLMNNTPNQVELSEEHFNEKGSMLAQSGLYTVPFDDIKSNEKEIIMEFYSLDGDTELSRSVTITQVGGKHKAKYNLIYLNKHHTGDLVRLTPIRD